MTSPAERAGHVAGDATRQLTWSQKQLWTGQRLFPESPLYNMVLAFDIRGDLDHTRFELAFRSVVNRADALRTTLAVSDDPAASIRHPYDVRVELLDLSESPDAERAADAWMTARAQRPLDFAVQLYDCVLIRLNSHRHIWFLNQHHLITDAWSTALVFNAVADAYVALDQATPDQLPQLAQYAGFAGFMEGFSGTPHAIGARKHWQAMRERGLTPLALYGKTRVRSVATRTERVTLRLGRERSDRILALSGTDIGRGLTSHASAFNVFATLVASFLAKICNHDDITIGTLSHNRPNAVLKQTIGVFVELFPLRVCVESAESFVQVLARVKHESASLLRYALPGTSDGGLSRSLNVVLNYMTASFGNFAGMPTRFRLVHSGHGDATHDLRIQIHNFDGADGFSVEMDFAVESFDAVERERASAHFLAFIDAVLRDPQAPLSNLALIGPAEDELLRQHFSGARAAGEAVVSPPTVLTSIRAGVAHHPDREAVVCDGRTWSYADLYGRALGIAAALEPMNVRGRAVALALPRSPEAVAAMLGVLEAGGFYVPLDASAPQERIEHILAKSGAAAILVSDNFPVATALPTLDVHHAPTVAPAALENALSRPLPDDSDLAYVLFTSGSTGIPKGVMIEHGSLSQYAHWAAAEYLPSDDHARFAVFTPLTFDLTVTSIFAPLVAGRSLVVYRDKGEAVDMSVLNVFEEDAVDVVKLTPSHLSLVGARRPGRIQTLIIGGEDLRREVALAGRGLLGGAARVVNEYGPTEATVACTLHDFDPVADRTGSVPIGRPIPGATIVLVDGDGHLVPAGAVGEIAVGGSGVARGYLGDVEQTAACFVADPLNSARKAYRTGDAGRWRSDGTLEYLGRLDRQVKVHGVRVEPAEIEAVLAGHPDVANCAVVALEGRPVRAHGVVRHCVRCGIPSDHPDVRMGPDDICSLCGTFKQYQSKAGLYFGRMEELTDLIRQRASMRSGDFDCLMLLSGGKDSSYALCRLVEMGFRVLAVTLDNGYISEGAKDNVRRVTQHLGVPHEFMSTPVMDQIFVDSLERFSNVCQGCFKTLYTLAFNIALERGIPSIVTGLSRGQFFETRLTEELFFGPQTTRRGLELVVLDARKAYHRANDFVNSLLNTQAFSDDQAFDRVEFVDFYRFCDVDLDEMLRYLDEAAPWIRPLDTGRSTNCLINDVGIHVHKIERGYHNYALPYSWDVRLGHKKRDDALEELNDEIDERRVEHILNTIGYAPKPPASAAGTQLTAFVTGERDTPAAELRGFLRRRLPGFMIPSRFIHVDAIPLTPRGKVDVATLQARARSSTASAWRPSEPPSTPTERALCRLWSLALQLPTCGLDDNFFDAGGDSITAIRVASRANAEGLQLTPNQVFRHQTVRELARVLDEDNSRADRSAEAFSNDADGDAMPSAATLSRIAKLIQKADRTARRGTEKG